MKPFTFLCLLVVPWIQGCYETAETPLQDHDGVAATQAYLQTMTVETFERNGSDFTNSKYSPLRLGKPLEKIDRVYDYDFKRLAQVENKLKGVDRRKVLSELFGRICAACKTDQQRHLAVLEFCNKASFNNAIQPMWPDKTCVYDPLILLELGEQRCGQIARAVVALFRAGGHPGRLVQLGMHTSSEVYYDDDWHYIDAGLFGAKWTVLDEDGSIPSYAELSRRPYAIDAMPSNFEPTFKNKPLPSSLYSSWFYFSRQSYSTPALLYVKTATRDQEKASRIYGWEYYKTVEDDERVLGDFDKKYHPGAPLGLRRYGNQISWQPADDFDGDLIGYRVYIGSTSRGWCYGPNWKPSMYDAKFKLPPSDVAGIETTKTTISLPSARPLFVTVMAYDKHGESVGRKLYPMFPEILVRETQTAGTANGDETQTN